MRLAIVIHEHTFLGNQSNNSTETMPDNANCIQAGRTRILLTLRAATPSYSGACASHLASELFRLESIMIIIYINIYAARYASVEARGFYRFGVVVGVSLTQATPTLVELPDNAYTSCF